jgi:hypothetical protein
MAFGSRECASFACSFGRSASAAYRDLYGRDLPHTVTFTRLPSGSEPNGARFRLPCTPELLNSVGFGKPGPYRPARVLSPTGP